MPSTILTPICLAALSTACISCAILPGSVLLNSPTIILLLKTLRTIDKPNNVGSVCNGAKTIAAPKPAATRPPAEPPLPISPFVNTSTSL